jgi:hypothetical protein
MPNPVTQAIIKQVNDPDLLAFVDHWDTLEEIVITAFKNKSVAAVDSLEFSQLQAWLSANYPRWQDLLEPFWRQSRIKGQAGLDDPFLYLLSLQEAGQLVGNWSAMKYLPAAREALNNFLLSKT